MEGLEIRGDVPIGLHPDSQLPIFVKTGKYGPYVQVGLMEKGKKKIKPKMASIPKTMNPTEVTVANALTYLSLPKVLGVHPETGKNITASIGRFGPYVVHDTDFRSVRKDDIYSITLERALEIIKEPKKPRGFQKKPARTAEQGGKIEEKTVEKK
jgi:DNA topoisomerase-1